MPGGLRAGGREAPLPITTESGPWRIELWLLRIQNERAELIVIQGGMLCEILGR